MTFVRHQFRFHIFTLTIRGFTPSRIACGNFWMRLVIVRNGFLWPILWRSSFCYFTKFLYIWRTSQLVSINDQTSLCSLLDLNLLLHLRHPISRPIQSWSIPSLLPVPIRMYFVLWFSIILTSLHHCHLFSVQTYCWSFSFTLDAFISVAILIDTYRTVSGLFLLLIPII